MQLLLVAVVALSAAAGSLGQFVQLNGHVDTHDDQSHMKEKNLGLSCSTSIVNDHGDTLEALGLSIQPQRDPVFSFFQPHSPYAQGFSKIPATPLTEKRLNATLILFSSTGGNIDVIITESGFVPDRVSTEKCNPHNFGPGLTAPIKTEPVVASADGQTLSGGTVPAAVGGVGLGPKGLPPAGFVSHFPQSPDSFGPGHAEEGPWDGLIFRGSIPEWNPVVSQLDNLGRFTHTSDVAGRSVVMCTRSIMGPQGKARCVGHILACCTLGYDNTLRPIQVVTP